MSHESTGNLVQLALVFHPPLPVQLMGGILLALGREAPVLCTCRVDGFYLPSSATVRPNLQQG